MAAFYNCLGLSAIHSICRGRIHISSSWTARARLRRFGATWTRGVRIGLMRSNRARERDLSLLAESRLLLLAALKAGSSEVPAAGDPDATICCAAFSAIRTLAAIRPALIVRASLVAALVQELFLIHLAAAPKV
jgi:hypothetical protein